ncbi:MAG TPA: DNA repair protein RadA [Candidatus Limnocylindrales bacterium]|nr:DNA repair protein RadA [Candidatus Limnocylindrales bacterium]
MARSRAASQYVCQSCAAAFSRWEGQCRSCGTWNSLVETLIRPPTARRRSATGPHTLAAELAAEPVPLGSLEATGTARRATGMAELDRVLGGGLVPGSLLVLGGEPGIGKSTLVLQVAAALAAGLANDGAGGPVLYASAEESAAQLYLRAARLDLAGGPADAWLSVLASTDVEAIIAAAARLRPTLLLVDSVQTVSLDELDGPPGSVGQVREVAARLGAYAREQGVPVLLIGHVTKDGSLAGPRTLEHLVDAVLMLEGDRYGSLRLLRALKNRHGSTEEVGVLEMTAAGLREVQDTAAAFLGAGQRAAPGVAVAAILEGSRALLVEVQALVAKAGMGQPRRTVSGLDVNRLVLLIAVLARRGGIDVSGRDVYASLAGGLTVSEPALDLPLALAIASSARDRAIAGDTLAFGEVSLLGEVRPVPGLPRRLREAARLGFRRALVPAELAAPPAPTVESGLELVRVGALREALEHALGSDTGTTG